MTDPTINLNAKMQPVHRQDLEDALQQMLEELQIKAAVTGGGSGQEPNGEIAYCDIELRLTDSSDENINTIRSLMESMLAPIGSQLIVHAAGEHATARHIPFGVHEGLGLYLNGKDLDDEVYKNYDINFVYQEIERLLNDAAAGHIASYWEGEETALYVYGNSYDTMLQLIQPLLDTYPLCQKCRVVQIA